MTEPELYYPSSQRTETEEAGCYGIGGKPVKPEQLPGMVSVVRPPRTIERSPAVGWSFPQNKSARPRQHREVHLTV